MKPETRLRKSLNWGGEKLIALANTERLTQLEANQLIDFIKRLVEKGGVL